MRVAETSIVNYRPTVPSERPAPPQRRTTTDVTAEERSFLLGSQDRSPRQQEGRVFTYSERAMLTAPGGQAAYSFVA